MDDLLMSSRTGYRGGPGESWARDGAGLDVHAYDEADMLHEVRLRQYMEQTGMGSAASSTLAAQQRFRATLLQTTQGLDYLNPDLSVPSDQYPLEEDAFQLLARRGAK